MPAIIRLALAIDLILLSAEQGIPGAGLYLPIAGTQFAQLGLVVIVAIAILEVLNLKRRE